MVIMVSFVGLLSENERMVNIKMVHRWIRYGSPLLVILMGVFTMYDVKWQNIMIKVSPTL